MLSLKNRKKEISEVINEKRKAILPEQKPLKKTPGCCVQHSLMEGSLDCSVLEP